MKNEDELLVFTCTPTGTIASGIRRLARLFSVLAALMLLAALGAWLTGSLFPGLLALGVAGLVGLAWRMSNDLRPRRLILQPGQLIIETPRQRIEIAIEGAQIRKLTDEEIAHVEGLVTAGGIVSGSGGFDSRFLGEFDLYASDLEKALFIQGLGVRLVVTPDDPRRFSNTFQTMAASPLLQSSAHE